MPRPPKPTPLLEIGGTYRKDRHGKRNEPTPKAGIGPYPSNLPVAPADIWDELVNTIVPGVLGDTDRAYLSIICELLSQFRRDPEGISGAKLSQLTMMLGKLGMNPVDRMKIQAPKQEEKENPEDEFF